MTFAVQRNSAELTAVHVRDPIVFGEPLVEKRVVGFQKIEDAAVLAHDILEEQLRFLPQRLPQIVVNIGKESNVGNDQIEVAKIEPLPPEVSYQRLRPLIGQQPPHLLLQYLGPA